MFHEIIKHTRKIKDKLEEKKESSSERWKEIITELLIIIRNYKLFGGCLKMP